MNSSARSHPGCAPKSATSDAERSAAEFKALRHDLQPFAHRTLGSLRIDMADVRVALAALDAALTSRGMTGWRPIETAPCDGTEILLYEGFQPHIGAGYWNTADAEWRSSCGNSALWKSPTHWMPLPDPPLPTPDQSLSPGMNSKGTQP